MSTIETNPRWKKWLQAAWRVLRGVTSTKANKNSQAVLGHLRTVDAATAAEISAATGLKRVLVQVALLQLLERGNVKKGHIDYKTQYFIVEDLR